MCDNGRYTVTAYIKEPTGVIPNKTEFQLVLLDLKAGPDNATSMITGTDMSEESNTCSCKHVMEAFKSHRTS